MQPGRKPFHTLNPPWRSSTTGGSCPSAPWEETQPQVLAQIFTRYATFGMGLADAVDAPRWLLDKGRGAAPATLRLESRFDPGFVRGLAALGHEVEEGSEPYVDNFGHAGMLVKHPRNGRVEATHDPRSDGGALGL